MTLKVLITNRQRGLRLPRRLIERAVTVALQGCHARGGEVSVVVVGDREIRRLNATYLGHDNPTDVLAFPLDGPGVLGEIVVSAATARREAKARDLSPAHELLLYVTHGALHLAGHRDDSRSGVAAMRRAEAQVLASLGIRENHW
ncbi:MAG: rRNA maturation RNase YbeY [Planctomycetota bacterium]